MIRAVAIALALCLSGGLARADAGERLRTEIQAALPAGLTATDISVPRQLASLPDSAGPVSVEWRRPARAGWLSLRATIGSTTAWVRVRLRAVGGVVVATRDLPAGHVIGESDVTLEMRPVVRGAPTIGAVEAAVGRALRQPARAGSPIETGAVDRAAPLPRGRAVTCLVRRGRLSISADGVLERPAAVGQATTARLKSSGRIVHGRLVDSSTVLVEVSR